MGDARKPPVYLQPGNLLRTSIEGLGECLNQCVPEKGRLAHWASWNAMKPRIHRVLTP